MSVLEESFKLVDSNAIDASKPKLVPLPRSVANELTILALLVPFAVSDLCAQAHHEVFATDASLSLGAICSAEVDIPVAQAFWRVSRSKGAYTRLLTPFESLAKRLGTFEELGESHRPAPDRP